MIYNITGNNILFDHNVRIPTKYSDPTPVKRGFLETKHYFIPDGGAAVVGTTDQQT